MIKNLVALPYELARLPLTLVDKGVGERLRDDSVPRLTLDRTIGAADKLAGAVLRNRSIAERGAERVDRANKLAVAVELEQEAGTRRQQAREAAAAARTDAAEKRKTAQERISSGLDEADAAEVRGKQEAEERAAETAAAKKAAADDRAASKAATVEKRKARVESAAEATRSAARRESKAALDSARENKQAAEQARDDAERLSDLAEAKKQERQKK